MTPFSHHSLAAKLLHLLRQGLTPEKLALSIALGVGISCFPVPCTTTLLCTLVVLIFRLNLPAIQIGNYLATPLQFLLLVPFLRIGERLLHSAPLPIVAIARTRPHDAVQLLLRGQWHAILGWMLVAPPITALLAALLRPFMRMLVNHRSLSPDTHILEVMRQQEQET